MQSGVYLPKSVFCHGHVYVALGRNKYSDELFMYADQAEFENLNEHLDSTKTYTRNIVYPELLRD